MTVSNPRRDDMRTAPSAADEPALLQRLREGDDAAFGELFELHAAAVRRLALGMAADRAEAEDITAETFFRVLQALRRGSGPRDNVRAYLLTVARRVCWEWHGARRDVPVSDDELNTRAGAGADSQARAAEHNLISRAFSSLPERWRSVLWQTEVEGEQPAVVAPHFGLSPNATAALARRARLGLRAAYLQAHLAVHRSSDGCRTVMEKLGGYTAGSVTGAEARKIRAHLIICATCRSTHDELRDVCSTLRAHAGVVVLLVPASALAFGSGAGAGIGSAGSIGSVMSMAGTAGGTGAAGTVGAGAAGGFAMAVGAKVKVGLALASTAAAGAFGVAVGPVVDSGPTQTIGLPGGGGTAELSIEPSKPSPIPRTSEVAGTGWRVPEVPGQSKQRQGPTEPAGQQANEYQAPKQLELPGQAEQDRTVVGGHELPGTSSAPEDRETSDSQPRIDKPDESGESTEDTTVLDTSTGPTGTPTNPSNTPTSGTGDPTTPREIGTTRPGGGARVTDESSAHDEPRPRDTIKRDAEPGGGRGGDTGQRDGGGSSGGQARSDLEPAGQADAGTPAAATAGQARQPIIRVIVIQFTVADGDGRTCRAGLDG
ncbi:RNA polymerase sigma factor, sigma-70 family [Amycolatopsis marina]|uniref:RNA polymerase sigma factor, sigma-70 family n=1 Tax=Amycolatopsis marina TaxID=490629 RepID=A0A1I0W3U8_9PSEU|nr:sigma-70 family RNA polymerase sigma factor [Amycolatopsis marina]SFA83409.1 RNA polymerase sigma factor, sigma-70 family [Amycolatopsis marina]